jgi:tetratricopeptide (TPR) repeat protein
MAFVLRPPFSYGRDSKRSRDWKGAGAFLTLFLLACLHAQTADPEEILKRAIGLHQAGNIDGAIQAYQQYLAQRPDSLMALSNLGAAYAKVARYQDAIVQYRRALKLQPGNTRVELNLALAFYKSGQPEPAASTLEKVHRAAPDELQPILLLADCWLAMGENRKVIELLTPVAESRPADLAIAYQLGMALVRDNQPARGQIFIDRILRNGDSAETWLLLGTAKLNVRDYPAALADLSKAVALNGNLPDVYSYYGQALLRTGDPVAATDAFRKALAANPYDFTANLQLGGLLKDDEKFEESIACLRRALQVRPNDVGVRYQLATIAMHDGKLEAARRDLEAIVKEAPAYREAHVTLATVYYRLNRKADGDRERSIVSRLNAEAQAKQQEGVNVK